MQIVWKGQACFFLTVSRGKQEQVRVLIDPYEESLGLKLSPTEADVLLITHEHYDHNNRKAAKGNPFEIVHPGEYDVAGMYIQGIPSFHDEKEGKERGKNTIYTLEAEGIKLCHLGDIGQPELTPEQLEQIGNVDILFVPTGGVYTTAAKAAADIVNQIEPRIVIPMHYALPKLKVKLEGVEEFLRVLGHKEGEKQQKLVIKQKDLTGIEGETKVVVLNP